MFLLKSNYIEGLGIDNSGYETNPVSENRDIYIESNYVVIRTKLDNLSELSKKENIIDFKELLNSSCNLDEEKNKVNFYYDMLNSIKDHSRFFYAEMDKNKLLKNLYLMKKITNGGMPIFSNILLNSKIIKYIKIDEIDHEIIDFINNLSENYAKLSDLQSINILGIDNLLDENEKLYEENAILKDTIKQTIDNFKNLSVDLN